MKKKIFAPSLWNSPAGLRRAFPCRLTATTTTGIAFPPVSGDIPETARNRALTAADTADRLKKTGGTAYCCQHAEVTSAEADFRCPPPL